MNPLKHHILELIRSQNGIGIDQFMMQALLHPEYGYYTSRDPLSAHKDFITAPMQGQMFGEIIGLWTLSAWEALGKPDPFHLVEFGAGTGHMLADIIRVLKINPACYQATRLAIIEVSPALKAIQAKQLAHSDLPLQWYDRIEHIPKTPIILLGNEFLDCLPIRQFIFHHSNWYERLVGLASSEHPKKQLHEKEPEKEIHHACFKEDQNQNTSLIFTQSPLPLSLKDIEQIPTSLREGKEGAIFEICPAQYLLIDQLSQIFNQHPGLALFIDYGSIEHFYGSTLQAIKGHQKHPPLKNPGIADLTAHVNFAMLGEYASSVGLGQFAPLSLKSFLQAHGIESRAAMLIQQNPEKKDYILRQLWRLTASSQMGELFKCICLSSTALKFIQPFKKQIL